AGTPGSSVTCWSAGRSRGGASEPPPRGPAGQARLRAAPHGTAHGRAAAPPGGDEPAHPRGPSPPLPADPGDRRADPARRGLHALAGAHAAAPRPVRVHAARLRGGRPAAAVPAGAEAARG